MLEVAHRPSPVSARLLRCGRYMLLLRRPLMMGVVNVTPDSFSDGGRFLHAERAVAHGRLLAEQGADILDIGGESTRPGATPLPLAQEVERGLPGVGGPRRR